MRHYAVTVMEVPWTSMRRAWYLYIWHEETREWQRVKDDVFYAYCYYWHKDATPLDVVQWCKQYLRGQNVAFYESISVSIFPTTLSYKQRSNSEIQDIIKSLEAMRTGSPYATAPLLYLGKRLTVLSWLKGEHLQENREEVALLLRSKRVTVDWSDIDE